MAGLALLGFGPPLITSVLQGQVLGLSAGVNGIINSAGAASATRGRSVSCRTRV